MGQDAWKILAHRDMTTTHSGCIQRELLIQRRREKHHIKTKMLTEQSVLSWCLHKTLNIWAKKQKPPHTASEYPSRTIRDALLQTVVGRTHLYETKYMKSFYGTEICGADSKGSFVVWSKGHVLKSWWWRMMGMQGSLHDWTCVHRWSFLLQPKSCCTQGFCAHFVETLKKIQSKEKKVDLWFILNNSDRPVWHQQPHPLQSLINHPLLWLADWIFASVKSASEELKVKQAESI